MKSRLWKNKNRTAALFVLSYLAVMIVPLSVSMGFYYPRMRSMLIEKATEQALSSVTQVKNDMDTQLFSVLSMPAYIFENKRIILQNLLNDPIARLEAKADLEQMIKTNTFISHLFLYLRDSDYFIVPRAGSFYFKDLHLYPGPYQTAFGDLTKDDLYKALEDTNSLMVKPVSSMMIAGKKYDKMLLFIMPFPSGSHARASLIVTVPASRLNAMASAAAQEDGNFLFFGKDGMLLHAVSPLAQGDETVLKEMLSSRTEASGTFQAALSGGENIVAWSLSQRYGWRHVQIIPMKMIIGEALKLQQSTMLVMAAVVALCFVLILIAMRLNYLPIKRLAALAIKQSPKAKMGRNDFEAIQQLITELKDDVDQLEKRLDMTEPQIREYLIAKILSGNAQEAAQALSHAESMSLSFHGNHFSVVIAAFDGAASAGKACERLQDDLNRESSKCIAAQLDTPEQIVLILKDTQDGILDERLLSRLEGYSYLVTGQTVTAPTDISLSYNTAYATLDYVRLKGANGQIMRYDDLPERVFNPRSYPLEVMQALESAIAHLNSEKVREMVAQIEAMLTVDGAPPYFTRSVYFNTVNLLISGLMRYLKENNETVLEIGMRSMLSHYTIQEMANILNATSIRLISIMEESRQNYSPFAKVLTYIDTNIASSDLSLQMVADHIGMSASAFSRSFKEKVGKNFKEYVDAVRIQSAKRLLTQTGMPIEQIATSVGYDTLTSFYRMFKKYTGAAPGEYRQANQK